MKLYHITDNLSQPAAMMFTPRVPDVNELYEDVFIPRVCLAPTIEGCMLAVPECSKFHYTGAKMRVYTCEVTKSNCNMFLPPLYLWENNMVLDAMDTGEVWCLVPIFMSSKCYEITELSMEHKLSFNNISVKSVINAFENLDTGLIIPHELYKVHSSEELFENLTGLLETHKLYNESDEFYESICKYKIVQTFDITKLTLKEIYI